MIIQIIASFIGTLSFAVIFSIPKKEYIFCGLSGAIGWSFYLLSFHALGSTAFATFVSTIVLTITSRVFAVNRRVPVTIFLISGIFPLVPGAGIYYTANYIFANQLDLAFNKGVESISIAIAIAFGIMLIFVIPQKFFYWGKKSKKRGRNFIRKWY